MLYVPTFLLKPGMTLACDILNPLCEGVCFDKGDTLSDLDIRNIDAMGLAGVYIKSQFTSEVVIDDCMGMIATAQSLSYLRYIYKNNSNTSWFLAESEILVADIIGKISKSGAILTNLYNLSGYDSYTYGHSLRVAIISILIGIRLKLDTVSLWELGIAALLHDVGKTNVALNIINKNDKLTNSEFDVIKQHQEVRSEYIKEFYDFNNRICDGVRYHHEHFDGNGYPCKLKGNDIPFYARIICVADVYDALTTRRPYREAWFPAQALRQMHDEAFMFDPDILSVLSEVTVKYPEGSVVILSTGEFAVVIDFKLSSKDRPTVRTLSAEHSKVIDLSDRQNSDIDIVNNGYYDTRISKFIGKE